MEKRANLKGKRTARKLMEKPSRNRTSDWRQMEKRILTTKTTSRKHIMENSSFWQSDMKCNIEYSTTHTRGETVWREITTDTTRTSHESAAGEDDQRRSTTSQKAKCRVLPRNECCMLSCDARPRSKIMTCETHCARVACARLSPQSK